MRGSVLLLDSLLVLCVGLSPVWAGELEWDASKWEPIRPHSMNCRSFLSLPDPTSGKVNDSVGLTLTDRHDPQMFREQMLKVLETKSISELKGSHLFFTGIDLSERKREFLRPYQEVLKALGFESGDLHLHVIKVPKEKVLQMSRGILTRVLRRMAYWFPNFDRHYQSPEKGEVVSGLISTAAVEAPNVIYLYQALPHLDFVLTITTHTALLTALAVYKKALVNWFLDPGVSRAEIFLKQAAASFPFILNYNVFGRFSEILNFYNEHGWSETLAAFPNEMTSFASTQGLTAFLQTIFYTIVITHGIRGWENSQIGDERSRIARVVSNYITVPILAVDAIFLAMAAKATGTILDWGVLNFNQGHLSLLALTITGASLWAWPQLLNPFIPLYRAITKPFKRQLE